VLIAVLTFRRPQLLGLCLQQVALQAAALSDEQGLDGERYDVQIVVVDNDPQGTGLAAVPTAGTGVQRIRYVLEPTPGISAGRNRALDEARHSELLAFIDDDELPQDEWLVHLVRSWRLSHAAAVAGRVVPRYEHPPDSWILAGGFFVRRNHPTGTEIAVAAAGNLLVDMQQVRSSGVRFESEFGLTGGEDTLFTQRLHRNGCRMVWCDESVVEDLIPSARLTRAWVLRRAWSHGNSTSLIDIHLSERPAAAFRARVMWGARGLARISAGCARVLLGHLRGSLRDRSKGSRVLCRGAGMLAGAVGYSYQEYSRPPSDDQHRMAARVRRRVGRSPRHTAPRAIGE
jgi:GT2 family glycosyltransferase